MIPLCRLSKRLKLLVVARALSALCAQFFPALPYHVEAKYDRCSPIHYQQVIVVEPGFTTKGTVTVTVA